MAIVWQSSSGDDHYQVRTAGKSVRLYKNKVFHSQWNDNRPLSGGVWDLLFLPALFLPSDSVKRVLLLGVGGGAVIRQYLSFLAIEQVVGVELDAQHLKVAREFFGVNQPNVELHQADALEWVKSYRGPKFDIVIDDLFSEKDGEPVRVVEASKRWFCSLRKLLRPNGALIMNFEEPAHLRDSGAAYLDAIGKKSVDCRYAFTLSTYGNCVGAFLSNEVKPATLRARLDGLLVEYPRIRASAQRFRVKRIVAKSND